MCCSHAGGGGGVTMWLSHDGGLLCGYHMTGGGGWERGDYCVLFTCRGVPVWLSHDGGGGGLLCGNHMTGGGGYCVVIT